jgi:hypothetical protein
MKPSTRALSLLVTFIGVVAPTLEARAAPILPAGYSAGVGYYVETDLALPFQGTFVPAEKWLRKFEQRDKWKLRA